MSIVKEGIIIVNNGLMNRKESIGDYKITHVVNKYTCVIRLRTNYASDEHSIYISCTATNIRELLDQTIRTLYSKNSELKYDYCRMREYAIAIYNELKSILYYCDSDKYNNTNNINKIDYNQYYYDDISGPYIYYALSTNTADVIILNDKIIELGSLNIIINNNEINGKNIVRYVSSDLFFDKQHNSYNLSYNITCTIYDILLTLFMPKKGILEDNFGLYLIPGHTIPNRVMMYSWENYIDDAKTIINDGVVINDAEPLNDVFSINDTSDKDGLSRYKVIISSPINKLKTHFII